MKKPQSEKQIRKECHEFVSLIVRHNERRCFTCGGYEDLQCGHLFVRSHGPTTFDIHPLGNNHTQCRNCNYYLPNSIYREMYVTKFGLQAFEELERRTNGKEQLDYIGLLKLKAELKQTWLNLSKS